MTCHAHDLLTPGLALPASGGTINPANFRGQRLALIIYPEDPAETTRRTSLGQGRSINDGRLG